MVIEAWFPFKQTYTIRKHIDSPFWRGCEPTL